MGSLIREGLWLGSLDDACNTSQLQKQGVTHILSIEFRPLPTDQQKHFGYMFIHALDAPDQDLISHFQECFTFIDEALASPQSGNKIKWEKCQANSHECGHENASDQPEKAADGLIESPTGSRLTRGGILVHCFVGFSRSATIVIAYLMYKEGLSLEEALSSVKERRDVGPNPGFREQLELFERLGCSLDKNKPEFRAFCLNNITGKIRELSFVRSSDSEPFDKDVAEDNALKNAMASDPIKMPLGADSVMFKCRKCRRPLARGSSCMTHPHGRGRPFAATPPPRGHRIPLCEQEKEVECDMGIFIEPVEWMQEQILMLEGKISCPKCKSKIGNFSWVGQSCPCGRWMVPAFHLAKNKIDKEFRTD